MNLHSLPQCAPCTKLSSFLSPNEESGSSRPVTFPGHYEGSQLFLPAQIKSQLLLPYIPAAPLITILSSELLECVQVPCHAHAEWKSQ